MPPAQPINIIIDTREQTPYTFANIQPRPRTQFATLRTGDYSLDGLQTEITIERKSLQDAFNTFGRGRRRFERELHRMKTFTFAAVILEADWTTVLRYPPTHSKLNPKIIYASVIAWQQRFNVHFWLCPNRAFAEKTTYRLLERFWKDHPDAKRPQSN